MKKKGIPDEITLKEGQMQMEELGAKFEEVDIRPTSNIVQANYLIEHKPKMSLDEMRMFETLLSSINKDDQDFKRIRLKVTDVIRLWGVPQKNAYRQVRNSLAGLLDKKFALEYTREDGTKYIEMATYISSFSYGEGDGYANVSIDPLFKPYLIDLKDRFTRFGLASILQLSSPIAMRTFELLMQYVAVGKREFTVADYKKKVGIEDKYKGNNANLKKYVLDRVVVEITEKTQLLTRYELKGRGEKAKIEFVIYKKPDEIKPETKIIKNFAKEEKDILMQLLKNEKDMDVDFPDEKIMQAIDIATTGFKEKKEVLGAYHLITEALTEYRDRKFDTEIKYPWAYFKSILESKTRDSSRPTE